jgi:hypothetical protein
MSIVGGVKPTDVTDANTISVFKQAVEDHNKKENDTLEFVELVSATKQVVSGFSFTGVVKVKKDSVVSEYNVKVWQKAGGQEIEVSEFAAK